MYALNRAQKALKDTFDKGYRVCPEGEVCTPLGKTRALCKDSKGYLSFSMGSGTRATPVAVHRLVAYEKYGNAIFEKGIHVRHLDGNKLNNSFDNIAIGTQSDNFMDRPAEERVAHAKLAAKSRRKLTDTEVEDLRQDREKGDTYKQLSSKYGISKASISYIINEKTYGR